VVSKIDFDPLEAYIPGAGQRGAQVAGRPGANAGYGIWPSPGERPLRQPQLKTGRRVFERRDLPLGKGFGKAGQRLASPQQLCQTAPALGCNPTAPAVWLTEASRGFGKVGRKQHFPLFPPPTAARSRALHPPCHANTPTGTRHWAGKLLGR